MIKHSFNIYCTTACVMIGVACILYAMFYRYFAHLHVQIPFVDLPLFVGEIILGLCFVLLMLFWRSNPPVSRKVYLILGLYLGWIFIKSIHGYMAYGPYAFRNAALFYYLLFAMFGFYFYQKRMFNQKLIYGLLIFSLILFKTVRLFSFHRYPLLIFYIVLALEVNNRWLRGLFLVLLFFTYDFPDLFIGTRSHYIGLIVSLVVMTLSVLVIFLQQKNKMILGVSLVSFVIFTIGMVLKADQHKFQSIFQLETTKKMYRDAKAKIARLETGYVYKPLESKLYSQEGEGISDEDYDHHMYYTFTAIEDKDVDLQSITKPWERDSAIFIFDSGLVYDKAIIKSEFRTAKDRFNEVIKRNVKLIKTKKVAIQDILPVVIAKVDEITLQAMDNLYHELKLEALRLNPALVSQKDMENKYKQDTRLQEALATLKSSLNKMGRNAINTEFSSFIESPAQEDFNNMVFRILIWEDMIKELKEKKAWFPGMNFGHPQRSRQIEILEWAKQEWERDGWITPHNSYLHMIYRGGIIGIVIILVMIFLLGWMFKTFIEIHSLSGVLLIGALSYLMAIANFLVMYELPYSAIPFWSLFGAMLAYTMEKRKQWRETSAHKTKRLIKA